MRVLAHKLRKLFETIYFDTKAEDAFKRPLAWLKLGVFLCTYNGILVVAMLCVYCLIPGHSLEVYTPILNSTTDWVGLVLVGYALIAAFLLYFIWLLEAERYDRSTTSVEEPVLRKMEALSRDLANGMKIVEPKVMITDLPDRPPIECLGYSAARPVFAVREDYIGILDDSELRAVLAHELHHFKHDADFLLYTEFFLKGVNAFRTVPLFFLGALSLLQGPLLLFFLPSSSMGSFLIVWLILYILIALFQIVGIFAGILYSVNSLNIINELSYVDVLHLEADIFAALATGQPFELATAEMKTESFRFGHKITTLEASKAIRGSLNKPLSTFSRELRIGFFSKPDTSIKIRTLLLVDALLFGEVAFRVKKAFKTQNLQTGFSSHINPLKSKIAKIDEKELGSIYQSLLESREGLNLTKLHELKELSVESMLSLFMFLLVEDHIELTRIDLNEKPI